MQFTIHDVGHGFCASLIHQNGNVMLWDCGNNDYNNPSDFLSSQSINHVDYFFVTNYDEDHISNLPDLRRNINIRSMYRNKTISVDQLRRLKLKSGPISNAMESLLDMIENYTGGPLTPAPDFPGVSYQNFYNTFDENFDDTNNISHVTFIECSDTTFVLPGDLEKAGWLKLLESQSFRDWLTRVNVFVASHHGRENGYCPEVFDYCTPGVIIFSDSSIKHATQEMADTYANHANGINFNGETRYVLSTRKDGSLQWTID